MDRRYYRINDDDTRGEEITKQQAVESVQAGVPVTHEDYVEESQEKPGEEERMGFESGFDAGDLVEAVAPWTSEYARTEGTGAPTLGSIGRGVADAAMWGVPVMAGLRTAKMVGVPMARLAGREAIKRFAAPAAAEAVTGAVGQTAGDIAFRGEASPMLSGMQAVAPFVPLAPKAAFNASRSTLANLGEMTARRLEAEEAPVAASVVGAGAKSMREFETPMEQVAIMSKAPPIAEAKTFKETATALGLPENELPAAYVFGPQSTAAHAEKKAFDAQDLATEMKFRKAHEASQAGWDNLLEEVSGGQGFTRKAATEGAILRETIPERISEGIQAAGTTYSQIGKVYPDLTIGADTRYAIGGALKRHLDDMAEDPEDYPRFGNYIKKLLGDGKEAAPMTLKRANDLRVKIGKIAYAKDHGGLNMLPIEVEALQDLYGALSDGIISSLRSTDPKMAEEIITSNKALAELLGNKDLIAKAYGNAASSDEQVFNALTANTKRLEGLAYILKPEEIQRVTAAKLDAFAPRLDNGLVKFHGLSKRLAKDETMARLLDPGMMDRVQKLVSFGAIADGLIPTTGLSRSFADPSMVGQVVRGAQQRVGAEASDIAQRAAARREAQRFQRPVPFSQQALPLFKLGSNMGARAAAPENWLQEQYDNQTTLGRLAQ